MALRNEKYLLFIKDQYDKLNKGDVRLEANLMKLR